MYWRLAGDIPVIAAKGEGVDQAVHSLATWPGNYEAVRLSRGREKWVASKKLPKCFSVEGHQWSLDSRGRTVCKHCLTYYKEGVYYW